MANYSYIIESRVLIDGDEEPVLLDGMIRSIEISKDYDRNVFPLLRLSLLLDFETYYRLQTEESVRFSVTIKKYLREDIETRNLSKFTYYMKDKVFVPIDRDKTPISKPDSLTDQSDGLPSLTASFMLMAKEDLDNNKRMVNGVLRDTDIEGAILYLASGFSRKPVLLERPNNQKIYDQIIFPPNNVIRSLKYLDTVYGIYNGGLRVFFDFDAYHIINKYDNANLPALEGRKKRMHIKIVDSSSVSADELMYETGDTTVADESDQYYTATAHIADARFVNYEDSKKEFVGTKNIIVSQGEESLNKNSYGDSESKTRVYYSRYSNPFKEKEMMEGGIMGFFLVCTLDAIDIDAITPNNEFMVDLANSNYSGYSGDFHIMKADTIFNIGDTGMADVQCKLYFRKK
jgi:hypothetical protein